MAYINVAEWSPDQVTDWLKGLDNSMYIYVQSFTNNQVGGQQLLNIRPYELEQLGMQSIGHQEIVLEAVEHLRNFHYHLDKENLQFLALHVATAASCLYRQLKYHCDKEELKTQILNDITRTLVYIKPLVAWLDRSPFQGHSQFIETRDNILKFGLEMATVAQRDRFVENPVKQIRSTSKKLAKLANYIIQDITDPMVLQPASLEIVTLKKRESDLGFLIMPSYHGVLRITDIKLNSPAHNSGKIEEGDEIVQINYQTVVGWQYKKVIMQLQESPTDVLLTLKKRPKHRKIYGQIYIKPYRLPSKKRALPYNMSDSLPSPRPELLSVPEYPLPLSRAPEKDIPSDSESINSDILTPTTTQETSKDLRMYLPKPRAVLQRRNTICGDQFSTFKNLGNILYWSERRNEPKDEESPSLRDKSISFGYGLEISRPTTCIGISSNNANSKINEFTGKKGSLPEMISDKIKNNDSSDSSYDSNKDDKKTGVSKVVRFDSNMKFESCHVDTKYTCNVDNTVLETFEPIPYVDEEINHQAQEKQYAINNNHKTTNSNNNLPDLIPPQQKAVRMSKDTGLIEAVNTVLITREIVKRGKLDKSHSTPAYAQEIGENDDIPPAIEPRKEFLNKTPPAPPPRPKRFSDTPSTSIFVNADTSKQADLNDESNKTKIANVVDLKNPENCQNIIETVQQSSSHERLSFLNGNESISPRYTPPLKKLPPTKHFLEEKFEALELLTPNKTKSLTLKKKNSLLAKRRKLSLKALGTSDIQGHLYRRSKDKHGVTYWAKLYFVLIESALYGFKSKDSPKANCLIFLTGFTVSLATEVHSKPFAFKVYHPSKTFYFAAETQQALLQWMEYIRQATIKGNTNAIQASTDKNIKELYTETESSDDDFFTSDRNKLATPSPLSSFGNKSSTASKNDSDGTPASSKNEKSSYHLNFGSLKKFTKSNLPSFSSLNKNSNSSEKKILSSDVPVPTAQFRSYRKVPGNAGLQLGTNSMNVQNIDISSNLPSSSHAIEPQIYTPPVVIQPTYHRKISITSLHKIEDPIPNESTRERERETEAERERERERDKNREREFKEYKDFRNHDFLEVPGYHKTKKTNKTLSHNYIHASNPNLVEFDFQTSKTLDHSLPKINSANSWDTHYNLQGFVTLKALMLQKQAEEAQEMYNNRVYLGVEKKDDRHLRERKSKNLEKDETSSEHSSNHNELKPVLSKIQSRSLPKTPDYAQSFKPDDKDIIMARSKEGQKLRDFGYEFISGDDQAQENAKNSSAEAWLRRNDKISPASSNSFKKKGMNWINSSDNKEHSVAEEKSTSRQGSLKKAKNRLDNLKASSEKLFQFKHTTEKDSIKLNTKNMDKMSIFKQTSSSQLTPMTLPLNKKSSSTAFSSINPNNISEWVMVGRSDCENLRKNSIPEKNSSYLSKLNFTTTKQAKERKLLGSPRLHRALFGRSASHCEGQIYDHETFTPINNSNKASTENVDGSTLKVPTVNLSASPVSPSSNAGSPDYPNMEYPPVFEAETYSLSDPNITANLMRRRNHNQNK